MNTSKKIPYHLRNKEKAESSSESDLSDISDVDAKDEAKRYSFAEMRHKMDTQEEKLNPIGLAMAAVILACCLICPMNKTTHSSTVDYFDYFMISTATLVLLVMILFCFLSLRQKE